MEEPVTDIVVCETLEREIRFVSEKVVCAEGLLAGQWVGQHWGFGDRPDLVGRRFFEPAFEIRLKDDPCAAEGSLVSGGWQWVSAAELPRTERGARHFAVELANAVYPVKVTLHTSLDGTPVLTRWLEIANTADKAMALSAVYPWSGRLWAEEAPIALGYATRWHVPWEGWFGWKFLAPGMNVVENDKGLVWDDPYFVLRHESRGEYFFGQLAWPANYRMEFEVSNGLSFRIGPSAVNELRVIAPGETIETPAVHLGHVKGDFDAAVQAMHDHIRRSVLPQRKPERSYLVQYLFPEDQPLTVYRGDEYNEANVKKCIDVAAAVGVEVFIVDGPTWAKGYGNWLPKEEWFPRGLEPVREYAHEQGLLFGLYAEPEGGRGDWRQAGAFQEHPEWFVPRNPDWPGPNFLNLAIPGAAAYMEAELTQLIERYKLDLYRHDQNGCFGGEGSVTAVPCHGGFIENDYWCHYDAFYRICARLRARYPELILQQASGGGSRLELATLGQWDEHYTSDRAAEPYVYQMSSGLSVYLPPEVLVTPNGMVGPEARPDLITLLRCIYALGNTPMIFNGVLPRSPEELNPEVRERFLHCAALYKGFIRPLLPTCKVYHHSPVNAAGGVESSPWLAMEFAAPDRQKAWAVVIRMWGADPEPYLFKPRGLDGGKNYRVTFDNADETEIFAGSGLAREGLSIRLETEPSSELLLFEAQQRN